MDGAKLAKLAELASLDIPNDRYATCVRLAFFAGESDRVAVSSTQAMQIANKRRPDRALAHLKAAGNTMGIRIQKQAVC